MQERQNTHALAPVEDFERVKQKVVRKVRLWRMTVIAGAAVAALVPAAVFADTEYGNYNTNLDGGGILTQIQHALATIATHTIQIAGLQGTDNTQNAQIAALQQQLATQNAAIAALQTQLNNETAARQAGDATGRAYTDSETARAKAAEAALAGSLAAVDNAATLSAAKAYTDAEMTRAKGAESGITDALAAEVAARKQGDADTLGAANLHSDTAVGAEASRATAAENVLGASIAAIDTTSSLTAAKAYTDAQVSTEAAARQQSDQTTLNAGKVYADAQVSAEAAARSAADAAINAAANTEVARAQSAETALNNTLNTEIARATAAEGALAASVAAIDTTSSLSAAKVYTDAQVSTEAAARHAADAILQTNLDAEVARAKQAEASIVGPDHAYTDAQIAAEAAARAAADATLTASLNNEIARAQGAEATLVTSLNNEIARATAGEKAALDGAVAKVETALTTMAKTPFGGSPVGPQALWEQIFQGLFG